MTPETPLTNEARNYRADVSARNARLIDLAERLELSLAAKTAECDRLREVAERYAARQNEEYMNLLRSLKVGETTSREAHALSYNAHSDAARREGG